MNMHEKRDDAVSPVIGVMLMLVVTIVIAAVVVTFGTGMAGDATATTPMALYEVDNIIMKGDYLGTFDLVHKGGDEMNLENLKVVLEPIGKEISGSIILERRVMSGEPNPDYESSRQDILMTYGYFIEDGFPEEYLQLIESSGGSGLSVPGKTGEGIIVSTGDRIRVPAKLSVEGITLLGCNDEGVWGEVASASNNNIPDEGSFSDMPPGTLVKWTLSDTRTNGIIAKGEFVVPKA